MPLVQRAAYGVLACLLALLLVLVATQPARAGEPVQFQAQTVLDTGQTREGPVYVSRSAPMPVGGSIGSATATPTVTSGSAYAANNEIGPLLTFSNLVLSAGGTATLQSISVHFKTAQTAPLDFLWCGASQLPGTTLTDKTALSVASADFDRCRAIHITDCTSLGTPTVCAAYNLALPISLSSGTTGYGVLVARGATNAFGSTSDVSVTLGVFRN